MTLVTQPRKSHKQQWWKSVQEKVPEELLFEVQELVGEITREQQIIVELSQPTKEEAQLTAVKPVQEAISEESLHELVEIIDEVGTEEEVPNVLMKSEKELAHGALVQPQAEEVEVEAARDMSPTHEEMSKMFTEKSTVYAKSRPVDRKQTRVLTQAEDVPIEPVFEIEFQAEQTGTEHEIIVDLGESTRLSPQQMMVESVHEQIQEELAYEVQEIMQETTEERQVISGTISTNKRRSSTHSCRTSTRGNFRRKSK